MTHIRLWPILLALLWIAAPGCSDDDTTHTDASIDSTQAQDIASNDASTTTGYPLPLVYWSLDQTTLYSDGTFKPVHGTIEGRYHDTEADLNGFIGDSIVFPADQTAYLDFGNVLNDVFAGADKKFTIAFWAKAEAKTGGMVMLGKSADTACEPDQDERQWITAMAEDGRVGFTYQTKTKGNNKLVMSSTAITDSTVWKHYAFVYDGSDDTSAQARVSIYIDGQKETTQLAELGIWPFDLQEVEARLAFGVRLSPDGTPCIDDGATSFVGSLDELAIWDQALNDDQVIAVRTQGTESKPLVE